MYGCQEVSGRISRVMRFRFRVVRFQSFFLATVGYIHSTEICEHVFGLCRQINFLTVFFDHEHGGRMIKVGTPRAVAREHVKMILHILPTDPPHQ